MTKRELIEDFMDKFFPGCNSIVIVREPNGNVINSINNIGSNSEILGFLETAKLRLFKAMCEEQE